MIIPKYEKRTPLFNEQLISMYLIISNGSNSDFDINNLIEQKKDNINKKLPYYIDYYHFNIF